MNRVLFITYYFPPAGGPGAQRPTKFAKYLREQGWEVCVIAPPADLVQSRWAPHDAKLAVEVSNVRIVRVAEDENVEGRRPKVDSAQRWASSAWRRVSKLLENETFDCVLITMSPFSLARIGLEIKRSSLTPVVFDLRDPWALDGWPTHRSWWHWQQEMRFMIHACDSVDGVIANTPEALRALRNVVSDRCTKRWIGIPNGYDAEDFNVATIREKRNGLLTIVHTGTLHSSQLYPGKGLMERAKSWLRYRPEPILPEGRTLHFLLSALRRLRTEGHPGADRVRIRCVGIQDAADEECVRESGVEDQVERLGYLPHDESVTELIRADALFLPLHGYLDRSRRSLIVPGKTYEYLASGHPILGCLPEGDARDLVERSGRGYLAYPTDEVEVAGALARLIDDWRLNRFPDQAPSPWVSRFERRSLTHRLATFLERIIGIQDECRAPETVLQTKQS